MNDAKFNLEIKKLKKKLDLEAAFYAGAADMIKLMRSEKTFSQEEFNERIRQSFESWHENK